MSILKNLTYFLPPSSLIPKYYSIHIYLYIYLIQYHQIIMLLSKLPTLSTNLQPLFSLSSLYTFARHKESKIKFNQRTDNFEDVQKSYAKQYFQQYRKQVENDTVIRNFRNQIFQKTNQSSQLKQFDTVYDEQQKQLNKLLQKGNKAEISKFSKKIMQHFINNKEMFKGKSKQHTFRDYADYSAYKTNNVSIQDRNYGNMDTLDRNNQQSHIYEFIDSLPQNYMEKKQVRENIQEIYPTQSNNMTISEYGRRIEAEHHDVQRFLELSEEINHENSFKYKMQTQEQRMKEEFMTTQELLGLGQDSPHYKAMLSTDAMNKIYDLYVQGWSVREISRRFGILPMRTKFVIWCRARLFNELLPKYGLKYLFMVMQTEAQAMQQNGVMDYGLDIDQLRKTDKYEEIVSWANKRVDAQRTPDQYTQALVKIQSFHKFDKYDMVQIGTHGKQNKKYLLKEWKIYRGKKSDDYFLKNEVFKNLMHENRKIKNVYY